jgi:hypothetical protein
LHSILDSLGRYTGTTIKIAFSSNEENKKQDSPTYPGTTFAPMGAADPLLDPSLEDVKAPSTAG